MKGRPFLGFAVEQAKFSSQFCCVTWPLSAPLWASFFLHLVDKKKLHLGIIGLKGDHQWKWLFSNWIFLEACQPEENCWHWEQTCQDQPGLGPRCPIYHAFAAFKWVLIDTEGPHLSLAFTLGIHSFLLSRRGIVGRRAPASRGRVCTWILWRRQGFGKPLALAYHAWIIDFSPAR